MFRVWSAVIGLIVLPASMLAQAPGAVIPRTADGKPDFSGIWQTGGISLTGGAQANVVQPAGQAGAAGQRGGRGGAPGGAGARGGGAAAGLPTTPSLQSWAAEKIATYTAVDDPTVHCLLPGTPRIFSMPMPFQIIQTPREVVMLFEAFRAYRNIPVDGRVLVGETLPSFMGESVGRWEGDTLVVEASKFNGRIWGPGAMRLTSDEFHVVERYTHNGATISYEAVISDPQVLTGPFVYRTTFQRPPDTRVMEYECLEYNVDIPHLVQ